MHHCSQVSEVLFMISVHATLHHSHPCSLLQWPLGLKSLLDSGGIKSKQSSGCNTHFNISIFPSIHPVKCKLESGTNRKSVESVFSTNWGERWMKGWGFHWFSSRVDRGTHTALHKLCILYQVSWNQICSMLGYYHMHPSTVEVWANISKHYLAFCNSIMQSRKTTQGTLVVGIYCNTSVTPRNEVSVCMNVTFSPST